MNFDDYQHAATRTDIHPTEDPVSFLLHGLVGEVGVLTAHYKKLLRDGSSQSLFRSRVAEELGDLLWYASTLATTLDLSLSDIAESNLAKVLDRWDPVTATERPQLDVEAPLHQQFPRRFAVTFVDDGKIVRIIDDDGNQVGDDLDSNAHDDDGYRFHDVFHLAHAAVLGWSPTLRDLLERKRKYDDNTDRVEDGARAVFTEEGIVAVVFRHAEPHDMFAHVSHIETELLGFIKVACEGLEVSVRTLADWESAILQGYEAFRLLKVHNGGRVVCDLDMATISVEPPSR